MIAVHNYSMIHWKPLQRRQIYCSFFSLGATWCATRVNLQMSDVLNISMWGNMKNFCCDSHSINSFIAPSQWKARILCTKKSIQHLKMCPEHRNWCIAAYHLDLYVSSCATDTLTMIQTATCRWKTVAGCQKQQHYVAKSVSRCRYLTNGYSLQNTCNNCNDDSAMKQ